jgi:hypothetical protein
MATKVRVPRNAIAFGGWKGLLEIDGDVLRVVGDDPANHLEVDCSQVKTMFLQLEQRPVGLAHDGRQEAIPADGWPHPVGGSKSRRARGEQLDQTIAREARRPQILCLTLGRVMRIRDRP